MNVIYEKECPMICNKYIFALKSLVAALLAYDNGLIFKLLAAVKGILCSSPRHTTITIDSSSEFEQGSL